MASSVLQATGFSPRCCGGVLSLPSSLNSPYSLSVMPCLIARSRRRTLCSLEPVKYIRAAPQHDSSTIRRSTCTAVLSSAPQRLDSSSIATRIEAFFSPLASTFITPLAVVNASRAASGSVVAIRMSISPIVSLPRRSEPAKAHCCIPLTLLIISTNRSATPWAIPMCSRPPCCAMNSIDSLMLSTVFCPIRGSSRMLPSWMIRSRSSIDSTPFSSHISLTVLGPSP